MTHSFDLETIDGATVFDQDNDKIGAVKEVYLDDHTGHPRFATVTTGLFGMKETFIPLDAAWAIADGDLKVPYSQDFIKDAPNIDPDGHLEPEEERQIFEYYGLDYNQEPTPAAEEQDAAGEPGPSHVRLRKRVITEYANGDVRKNIIDVEPHEDDGEGAPRLR
ncbi:MAG TPA: PRC-barrel domain-containing protein [Enteractinococcus sp.]